MSPEQSNKLKEQGRLHDAKALLYSGALAVSAYGTIELSGGDKVVAVGAAVLSTLGFIKNFYLGALCSSVLHQEKESKKRYDKW